MGLKDHRWWEEKFVTQDEVNYRWLCGAAVVALILYVIWAAST